MAPSDQLQAHCTSGEGNSCSETVPANVTSYNLTVDGGVQYTITVSALSNRGESQGNPQLNFSMLLYVHIYIVVRFT